MKLQEIHTCPVWELPDGSQKVGMDEYPFPGKPNVVGWVNVLRIKLAGEVHDFLAVYEGEPA